MTIDKNREQTKLCLMVKGRLDTATAPQLEEAVGNDLAGIAELYMDFTELEYISSAGLRVLLTMHKTMKKQSGAMIIKGANEEVREVFTITGFAQILNIEK